MIKYASNAFLAAKISFINEIGQLCERSGADVMTVAYGMGLDKRIGPDFLRAGIGYGGSCFPKDVAALYRTSTDQAYDFKLLRGVMEVNERQKDEFVDKVVKHFGKNLDGKTFAVLGLAFKGNTDDIRESISIKVVKLLRGLGAKLQVFDPEAMANAKKELGEEGIKYCLDKYEAMEDADALFILTEWKEFANPDLERVKGLLKDNVIFDGRNLLDKHKVENAGFLYFAIGRPTSGLDKLRGDRPDRYYALLRNSRG
jgi:UDPglucose 6-dehydrogenase